MKKTLMLLITLPLITYPKGYSAADLAWKLEGIMSEGREHAKPLMMAVYSAIQSVYSGGERCTVIRQSNLAELTHYICMKQPDWTDESCTAFSKGYTELYIAGCLASTP